MSKDIPLKHAMIAWTPRTEGDGRVRVILHPDTTGAVNASGLTDTYGACNCEWWNATKNHRLLLLYITAWEMVGRDGIHPRDIHAAFMVIPEYRDQVSGEALVFPNLAP